MGDQQFGIDGGRLKDYAREIQQVIDEGVQVAIVIGGGNIFRGVQGASKGMDRVQGDNMGMLATMINGLALQSALENEGLKTRLQSAIEMDKIAEPFIRRRAVRHLEKGRVVIFGNGNPYHYRYGGYTSLLRLVPMSFLKGTVWTGSIQPIQKKIPMRSNTIHSAFRRPTVRAQRNGLDRFTLSRENDLPILVADMNKPGNLHRVVIGEKIVHWSTTDKAMQEELELIFETAQEQMDKAMVHLEKELVKIRAGRANPSMLEGEVDYHGNLTPQIRYPTSIHRTRAR